MEGKRLPSCKAGPEVGPRGVSVVATPVEGGGDAQTSLTGPDGRFIITNLLPGKYLIRPSHPLWMARGSAEVAVGWFTSALEEPFSLLGYTLQGRVEAAVLPLNPEP